MSDAPTERELVDEYGYDVDVLAQLAAIRETGAVNMNSIRGVRDVAEQIGFDETVGFIDRVALGGTRHDRTLYLDYLKEMARRHV